MLSRHFQGRQQPEPESQLLVARRQALHVQVLRFFCVWDDRRALFGDRRPYRLHYFLEDGSCEILETREANSGREPFPVFLRRGPLPKVRKAVLTCFKCLPRLLLCRAANTWRCCEKEPTSGEKVHAYQQ